MYQFKQSKTNLKQIKMKNLSNLLAISVLVAILALFISIFLNINVLGIISGICIPIFMLANILLNKHIIVKK